MKINIRERGKKVWQCWQESTNLSRRAIAKILGISKSSVQRHLTSQFKRQKYPESQMWETEAGQDWLRLLVFGTSIALVSKGG
jgi:predicted ArsR family transcriptional regulator